MERNSFMRFILEGIWKRIFSISIKPLSKGNFGRCMALNPTFFVNPYYSWVLSEYAFLS
jgi:hypothetical protein